MNIPAFFLQKLALLIVLPLSCFPYAHPLLHIHPTLDDSIYIEEANNLQDLQPLLKQPEQQREFARDVINSEFKFKKYVYILVTCVHIFFHPQNQKKKQM